MAPPPPSDFEKGHEEKKKKPPPRPRSTSVHARHAQAEPGTSKGPAPAPRVDTAPPRTSATGPAAPSTERASPADVTPSGPREDTTAPRIPAPGPTAPRPALSATTTAHASTIQRSTSHRDLRAQPSAAEATSATTGQRDPARDPRRAFFTAPSSSSSTTAAVKKPIVKTIHKQQKQLPLKPAAKGETSRPPTSPPAQMKQPVVRDSPMSPDEIGSDDQSPLARVKRDSQILSGLQESCGLSEETLAIIANYIKENEKQPPGHTSVPAKKKTTSLSQLESGPYRRTASQRSSSEEDSETSSAQKIQCSTGLRFIASQDPLPQRTTARNYASVTAASTVTSAQPSQTTPAATDDATPLSPVAPAPATTSAGNQEANIEEKKKKIRYPPLVVEQLPDWTSHFQNIKDIIGRAPNARPLGNGVRFTPQDEDEYRAIQRYLEDMEPQVPWFSYTLPKEKDVKIAIRGLPFNTKPEDIKEDLHRKGFDVEYTRRIQARQGRPGCIFFGIIKKTEDSVPAIYHVKEILCMPGIRVENWRGRRGPAQCHRCQQFRHSSHCCHRKQACVRCGEEHLARECPRPLTEPATCANCKGSHPANSRSCPVLKKEMKNKRAGTIALTTSAATGQPIVQRNVVEDNAGTNLMAPANLPKRTLTGSRGDLAEPSKKKKKKKKKKKPSEKKKPQPEENQQKLQPSSGPEAARTTAQRSTAASKAPRIDEDKLAVIEIAIKTLQDVLNALKSGNDPVSVIMQGMSKLITVQYG